MKDFEIDWPTRDQVERDIKDLEKIRPLGHPEDHTYIGRFHPNGQLEATSFPIKSLFQFIDQRTNKGWVAQNFLRFRLTRLDGRTRFDLTNDQQMGDLLSSPQNVLSHIFQDDSLREKIRQIVFDAFGLYFVIDPLHGGQLRIRLSATAPAGDEQSLNQYARNFHQNATHIRQASDGVQAFVGIITAVLSGEYRGILVDEPEAFLHPPLARKLGKHLAAIAQKRGGFLLASTHSADFLIGCVQASKEVRVVRLEYSNRKSKGRFVDSVKLEKILRTPLLRSANVISALFHDGVVVTESDNDRAFYAEIYYRIAEQTAGMPSVLFINAQNKQTIADIIEPLREFGIPAAAIVDIDILKDGGKVWGHWLSAAKIPNTLHQGYSNQRDSIKKSFEEAGKDMKNDGGVNALPQTNRDAANELFDILDKYGIFVVRQGELESWLPFLGKRGYKTDWTVSTLDKLGSDPSSSAYVTPTAGDVWDFMNMIVSWIRDPSRKGVA